MTTATHTQARILHGDPTEVMGQVALLRAHQVLVHMSEPRPLPDRPGQLAVKVWATSLAPLEMAKTSSAVAVRRAPAVALRHPAAKPGWSLQRKLAVGAAVLVPASAMLGWLVSQLVALDLRQMATTALGFAALLLVVVALVRRSTGHSAACVGLHCPGCKG